MARLTVVGDVLLDRDVAGTVSRICPDAPVPVVDVTGESARPGGAGLAATLLSREGHDVTLVASLGADPAGSRLLDLLVEQGITTVALDTAGRTREKVRVRAGGQTMLRLDSGTSCPPADELPSTAGQAVESADAVLVSDYGGGVTHHPRLRRLLAGVAPRTPIVWDPHVRGGQPVAAVRVATPNDTEAGVLSAAATQDGGPLLRTRLQAEDLVRRWQAHAVAITLAGDGALLSYGSGTPTVVPAPPCPSGDTCGAGDRFAAAVTARLADGAVLTEAVTAAVADASAFVAAGAVGGLFTPAATADPPVDGIGWDRVRRTRDRNGTVVATGGCFDLLHAGHVAMLRAARDLGDCLVVCLNSDASVRRLKGADRPLVPEADRRRVLEALEFVDAVLVFDEDTPVSALRRLRPDIWAKGGDYAVADLPEKAVLDEWNGQAVLLPYLDGRSTTDLIGAAHTVARAVR